MRISFEELLECMIYIIILVVIFYTLALIVEFLMMPCLNNISQKYGISEKISGYFLAFGSSIPEFTTNLISSYDLDNSKSLSIGLGSTTASGCYDFTLCLGIASLYTYGDGLNLNKKLYYRETLVYLFTILLIIFFLRDSKIELYETIIMILLCPIGIYFSLNYETDIKQNYFQELKNINDTDEENCLIKYDNKISIISEDNTYVNKTILYILKIIVPDIEKYPILSFLIIMIYTFFQTKLVFILITNLSRITNVATTFLGMTLICWGGTVGDTMNATVAVKLKTAELLITSIIGSQVINLQLCLGIPWTLAIIRKHIDKGESFIINFPENILSYITPAPIVVLLSILIITIYDVKLNKKSGFWLTIVYILYLVIEFKINIK